MREEILAEIHQGIEQKVLVEKKPLVIELVLASPALTLARRAFLTKVEPKSSELEDVFSLIWKGISR